MAAAFVLAYVPHEGDLDNGELFRIELWTRPFVPCQRRGLPTWMDRLIGCHAIIDDSFLNREQVVSWVSDEDSRSALERALYQMYMAEEYPQGALFNEPQGWQIIRTVQRMLH